MQIVVDFLGRRPIIVDMETRWTTKTILAKALAMGLRVTDKSKYGDITIWNRTGGVTLWEDGSATRADVRADLAIKMTRRQVAEFLFQ